MIVFSCDTKAFRLKIQRPRVNYLEEAHFKETQPRKEYRGTNGIWRNVLHLWRHGKEELSKARQYEEGGANLRRCSYKCKIQTMV
jgi:hypothetical protein